MGWTVRESIPVQTGPGANPNFYTMGSGSFPGVERPGRGVNHPTRPSAEFKKKSRALAGGWNCVRITSNGEKVSFYGPSPLM